MWWKNPLIVLCKNAPNSFNTRQFTHNLHMLLLKCRPREQGMIKFYGRFVFLHFQYWLSHHISVTGVIVRLPFLHSKIALFASLLFQSYLIDEYTLNCLPCRFVSSSLTDCDNNSCWLTSYAADRNMVLRKRRHKGLSFLRNLTHRQEEQRQKQRQRSSLLFGGQNLFNSLPHKLLCNVH